MTTSNKPVPTDLEIRDEYAAHLNALSDLCYGLSAKGGWWTNLETDEPLERNKGEMLMLIVTEISEAMEGVRKGLPDDKLPHRAMEEVELVDAMIRIFDYAGGFGFDLGGALVEKLRFNQTREDHKLENRKKDGGKKC